MARLTGYVVHHAKHGVYKVPVAKLAGLCKTLGITKKALIDHWNRMNEGEAPGGWTIVAEY